MSTENSKKPFIAPTLTVYGDVRQLTANGGTTGANDNPPGAGKS